MLVNRSKGGLVGALLLSVVFVINNVNADADASVDTNEKTFLTVGALLEKGYVQLSGLQLSTLLKENKIKVRDIETQAVSVSTRQPVSQSANNRNDTNVRVSKGVKEGKPLYFLDTRLLARAPPLEGEPDYTVSENELIATDGIRTYHLKFFEKQGKIYGARDIDNGDVFFEILVE